MIPIQRTPHRRLRLLRQSAYGVADVPISETRHSPRHALAHHRRLFVSCQGECDLCLRAFNPRNGSIIAATCLVKKFIRIERAPS